MAKIFIDNQEIETAPEKSIKDALSRRDKQLAKKAVIAVARDSGKKLDLDYIPGDDIQVDIVTQDEDEARDVLNHSVSHIMAYAVQNLYPEAKFAIGPAIKDGFYYDIDLDHTISPDDLPAIEKEMKRIIKKGYKFERKEVSKPEAAKIFKDNPYKLEFIEGIDSDKVSIYTTGDFVDLCSGPHIPSLAKVGAFKLLSVAGAYWRGNEENQMLTRVYGTAFFEPQDLKKYLDMIERAKQADHRKIGKELDLFNFNDQAPGFPFFHPKGMILRNAILEYWRQEHQSEGYEEIKTPIILSNELWKTSGHWDHYKDNMYFVTIDENDYAVKPMNCPGAILVYKSNQHSYKELPIRYAELGLVHRHEKSGVLHGLFRVRNFTQDDAHIFCTEEQLESEIGKVMGLVDRMYSVFGFDNYHVELSTRPKKRIGSDAVWDRAEKLLEKVMVDKGLDYKINEGDGAFYGPKIDFHIQDCLERTWQCATVQLDFAMPEKFDIEYVGADNQKHRPVMLHRVVLGSVERFIGILTEHYSGNFPLWLAPVQMAVLPISEKYEHYGQKVYRQLKDEGFRVEFDNRVESLSKKIRQSEVRKIPYMVIIGQNEQQSGTVTVRRKGHKDIKEIEPDRFVARAKRIIESKKMEL
ncbi:MAG: threonine--tRNA ligase [Actinomycetia bacterium]|nr:threonine--tRNA ligase [Actinomycetes bacterium]